MPRPHPREFREDVIRVARNREPGVRIKDVAADFGISEDELELHVVPVLLGGGARFFDSLGTAEVRLEQVRAVEARRRAPPVHGGDMTAAHGRRGAGDEFSTRRPSNPMASSRRRRSPGQPRKGSEMSHVFVTMAMSLDGFITGPQDDAQNPAGINGMRLMDWLGGGGTDNESGRVEGYRPAHPASRTVFDEGLATGAVITGKRTGDFAGYWGGDHHNGVPIFVPTHQPPADNPYERVHYVTDGIEACVEQAKAAAGDRDVMLHGAYTAQEALKARVLDAIEIQLRPVLLGQGRRLFDNLPPEHIELNLVRTLEAPGVLHLRYEVLHP